jgi:hypothetical protein
MACIIVDLTYITMWRMVRLSVRIRVRVRSRVRVTARVRVKVIG